MTKANNKNRTIIWMLAIAFIFMLMCSTETASAASNETVNKAVALKVNEKQTIKFDSKLATQYYKITIPKQGKYRMYIYSSYHNDSNKHFWTGVYSSAADAKNMRNLVESETGLINWDNSKTDYEEFKLKAKTYYIAVQAFNKGKYNTGIKFESVGPKSYTITYKLNGGKNSTNNPAQYTGTKKITFSNPTRKGYTFKGWYTKSNFSSSSKVTGIAKGTKKPYTVYAKWAAKSYNVAFNANGGSCSKKSSTVKFGSKYGKLPTPTKTNYVFKGWYTKKSGGIKVTGETKVATASKHTLYARWAVKQYNITYNLNGGANNTNNVKSFTAYKAVKFSAPTKKGHSFLGWYTDKNYTKKISEIKKGTKKNVTVYAKWKANTYTVSFDANGGVVDTTSKKVVYGKKYGELPQPTRDDYTFAGWYTNESGGTKVNVDDFLSTAKNHTLYARWNENPIDEDTTESDIDDMTSDENTIM